MQGTASRPQNDCAKRRIDNRLIWTVGMLVGFESAMARFLFVRGLQRGFRFVLTCPEFGEFGRGCSCLPPCLPACLLACLSVHSVFCRFMAGVFLHARARYVMGFVACQWSVLAFVVRFMLGPWLLFCQDHGCFSCLMDGFCLGRSNK